MGSALGAAILDYHQGDLQVLSGHWLLGTAAAFVPAPGCIDPARFRPSSCLTGYLAPNNLPPPTLVKLPGSTNMYV